MHALPVIPGAATAFLCAAVAALPLALIAGRGRHRDLRAWLLLGLLGVLDAINIWLYFQALAGGAVAPAVLSHYLAPVIVAVTAPFVLGEPRSPRMPLALGLALAGTAVLVTGAPGGADAHALIYGSCSAVFYASTVLVSKRLGDRFGDSELLSYHLFIAAGILAAVGGVLVHPRAVAGGLASAFLAGLLYYAGLRRVPAERAGLLAYLEPLAAVLTGWLLLGDVPRPTAAIGGVLILLGGAIGTLRYSAVFCGISQK